MYICPKCSLESEQSSTTPGMCKVCEKAYNSRISHYRQNHDWIAVAKENSIDLWLQQPNETQWEYSVWLAFRDSYPGKKPTYAAVAAQLDCTYDAVKSIAHRWSFQTRLQAWIKNCDEITLLQRRTEIVDMNKSHIDMSVAIREKLAKAITNIDPYCMKPGEIVALAKLSADMEKAARVDTIAQGELINELMVDNTNPELKKDNSINKKDMQEVLNVLMGAGVLGNVSNIGVRKTTTTEVVIGDTDGNIAKMITEAD